MHTHTHVHTPHTHAHTPHTHTYTHTQPIKACEKNAAVASSPKEDPTSQPSAQSNSDTDTDDVPLGKIEIPGMSEADLIEPPKAVGSATKGPPP